MAVLAEAISVVIRRDRINACFPQGWHSFASTVPNKSLCSDHDLVRVGFMSPDDTEAYVRSLSGFGLRYIESGQAADMVVVDQLRGSMVKCDWIEFGHVNLGGDDKQRVAACRLVGSTDMSLHTPEGWSYGKSLTQNYGFVPTQHMNKSLRFLRHENGLDVYENLLTGKVVYIARTSNEE